MQLSKVGGEVSEKIWDHPVHWRWDKSGTVATWLCSSLAVTYHCLVTYMKVNRCVVQENPVLVIQGIFNRLFKDFASWQIFSRV